MNNYTFSTLNDKEFEEFCKILLNKKYCLSLKSFPRGRDKGIDLLYSVPLNTFEIVVQVKHYVESSYSNLFSSLKLEVEKVNKINPKRYIIVTSQNLTLNNKLKIQQLFGGYIKEINDIISQQDLNDILSEFPEIEKKHYKLWLSSINILESLLNNAVESRSRYFLERIANKIKFYVPTNKINEANKILREQNILLITGQPGIGKTTLAEILLFERAKNGYEIYKIEDINEAENVLSDDLNKKQLFYFDDFLGANYLDLKNLDANESRLTSFVERIHNSKNKYLILTTRTIVYNRALNYNEKLSNSKINDTEAFELELGDYNKYEKALILYNHFYFNKLEKRYLEEIKKNRFYFKVIEHGSYTPRIIEFFTDPSKIRKVKFEHYRQFILNSLDKPDAIWSYSFNNQLEYLERCLLLTLFTFVDSAKDEELNSAFQQRLQFEKINNNQIIEVNQFEKSIKILLNGFVKGIVYENYNKEVVREYQFLNPSLTDYLINYANLSLNEKKAIVSSAIYLKQLDRFYEKKISFEKEVQIIFVERLTNNKIIDNSTNVGIMKTIDFLFRNCTDINVDFLIQERLKLFSLNEVLSYSQYESLIYLMENCSIDKYPQTYSFIKTNFYLLINTLLISIDEEYYVSTLVELFNLYEENYEKYFISNRQIISEFVTNVLKTEEETNIDTLKYHIKRFDEVESLYGDLEKTKSSLMKEFLLSEFEYNYSIDEEYWQEKIYENLEMKDERETITTYKEIKDINYDNKIIKLFR